MITYALKSVLCRRASTTAIVVALMKSVTNIVTSRETPTDDMQKPSGERRCACVRMAPRGNTATRHLRCFVNILPAFDERHSQSTICPCPSSLSTPSISACSIASKGNTTSGAAITSAASRAFFRRNVANDAFTDGSSDGSTARFCFCAKESGRKNAGNETLLFDVSDSDDGSSL